MTTYSPKNSQPRDRKEKIAYEIHRLLCKKSHIGDELCNFYNETWENPGPVKQLYLKKAEEAIQFMNFYNIESVHFLEWFKKICI